jgi:hypothetical protein
MDVRLRLLREATTKFHEVNREEVLRMLLAWIGSRLPAIFL